MPKQQSPLHIEVRLVTTARGRYAHLGVADTDVSRGYLVSLGSKPGRKRYTGVPASVTIQVSQYDFDEVKAKIMALA